MTKVHGSWSQMLRIVQTYKDAAKKLVRPAEIAKQTGIPLPVVERAFCDLVNARTKKKPIDELTRRWI